MSGIGGDISEAQNWQAPSSSAIDEAHRGIPEEGSGPLRHFCWMGYYWEPLKVRLAGVREVRPLQVQEVLEGCEAPGLRPP